MVPHPAAGEFARSYPGRPAFAADMRRDLRRFTADCGWTRHDVDDVISAVGELMALALAVRPPSVRVRARSGPDNIAIEIVADRRCFARFAPLADAEALPNPPRGLAMQVVRQLVDRISFSQDGRTAILVKRRPA